MRLCAAVGLVPDQRRKLKQELGKLGRDFLPATEDFKQQCEQLTNTDWYQLRRYDADRFPVSLIF